MDSTRFSTCPKSGKTGETRRRKAIGAKASCATPASYRRREGIVSPSQLRGGLLFWEVMPTYICGEELPVDVRAELEVFPWKRPDWKSDRLIACSPFRYDQTPSFYVYLTDTATAKAGSWGDSGADDLQYSRGGFVRLLSFLRQETTEETIEYLRLKYGRDYAMDPDRLTLEMSSVLRIECNRPTLNADMLREFERYHPYLSSRGISEEVQRKMRTGYCRKSKAVTIPWFLPNGELGNVKFRKVGEKTFWYAKGGRPIREMVYGMDVVYRERIKRAVLVEAEIDAMFIMTAGVPAIANGGSEFSEEKAEIIRRSPLEEVVIMADHDAAGQKFKRRVIELLAPHVRIRVAGYPYRYKDPNETKDSLAILRYISASKPFLYRVNVTL
jgi:5S rRNA maturation endonuclease (ribonuclease M5)